MKDIGHEIAQCMSGQEWSADTCQAIAEILRAHGYAVLDIADQRAEWFRVHLAEPAPSDLGYWSRRAGELSTPTDDGAQVFEDLITAAAEAIETFGEDELEDHAASFRRCPQCGGEGFALGQLGRLLHLRCRMCGWDFSREVPK